MRSLLLCLCLCMCSPTWSQEKYENFKEKLLEVLNSSQTTAQLAYGELSGFTRQETVQYYGEILQKEVDAQLIEVALAYYQNLQEESATLLLQSLCSHPQFGDLALKTLSIHNMSAFFRFAQELLIKESFLEYPYRSTLYTLLGRSSAPTATPLLKNALSKEVVNPTPILKELGKQSQQIPVLLPYLKDYPVPVLEALSRFGTPEELSVAFDFVANKEVDIRIAAIQALGKIKNEKSNLILLSLLQDESWIIRRIALGSLVGHFSEQHQIEPIITHFMNDSANRFMTLEVILSVSPTSLQTIETLLTNATMEEQRMIFLQLRQAKMEENTAWLPLLWRFLTQYSSREWLSVLLPLCHAFPTAQWLQDFPEQQILLEKLLQTEDTFAQIEVVNMIGECGIRSLAQQLVPLLNTSHEQLQSEVTKTLGKLGVSSTLPLLLEKIREPKISEALRFELQLAILRVQKER